MIYFKEILPEDKLRPIVPQDNNRHQCNSCAPLRVTLLDTEYPKYEDTKQIFDIFIKNVPYWENMLSCTEIIPLCETSKTMYNLCQGQDFWRFQLEKEKKVTPLWLPIGLSYDQHLFDKFGLNSPCKKEAFKTFRVHSLNLFSNINERYLLNSFWLKDHFIADDQDNDLYHFSIGKRKFQLTSNFLDMLTANSDLYFNWKGEGFYASHIIPVKTNINGQETDSIFGLVFCVKELK